MAGDSRHQHTPRGPAARAREPGPTSLDLDDPADYWYRLGIRDAYAYAAALVVTGRRAETSTQAAAPTGSVTAAGRGVTDSASSGSHRERRLGPRRPGLGGSALLPDRLGQRPPRHRPRPRLRWGPVGIRISHRRPRRRPACCTPTTGPGTSTPILDPRSRRDRRPALPRRARHRPHLPLADFVPAAQHTPAVEAQPDPTGVRL